MKIVIENFTNELFGSEIHKIDPQMEIISLNPEDIHNPSWENVPESDALFLSYPFLFAVRDNKSLFEPCLLYTSPSPRDRQKSRMPSSA